MRSNWLDNVIGAISPTWGFKRTAARYGMEFLYDYKGASARRPNDRWIANEWLWMDPIKEANGRYRVRPQQSPISSGEL